MPYVNTPHGMLLVDPDVMKTNNLQEGQYVNTNKSMALIMANNTKWNNLESNLAAEVALNVIANVKTS